MGTRVRSKLVGTVPRCYRESMATRQETTRKQGIGSAVWGRDISLPLLDIGGHDRQLLADGWGPEVNATAYQLLATIWGEIGLEIAGAPLRMPGGSILSIRPGVLLAEPQGQHKPGKFLYLHIAAEPASLSGSSFLDQDYCDLLAALDRHSGIVQPAGRKLMAQFAAFQRVLDQWCGPTRPPSVSAALMRAQTCITLLRFVARLEEAAAHPPTTDADPIVQAACDFMAVHYTEKIRLRQIADHVGYNVSWFAKRFRKRMGVTPGSYLQSFRVEKAKELLSTRDSDITEIALSTGFPDSQYFARVFRRFTGHSPSEYRRRCKARHGN